MSLAITMNLIAIVVVAGGWTAAVWAFYKHLDDPYTRARTSRQPDLAQAPDASSPPEPVLTGRRAA